MAELQQCIMVLWQILIVLYNSFYTISFPHSLKSPSTTFLSNSIKTNGSLNTQIIMNFINEGYPNTTIIYQNNQLNSQFVYEQEQFSCANEQLFTYNQTLQQFQDGQGYNLTFNNFIGTIRVLINAQHQVINPAPSETDCNSNCTIYVTNNCPQQTDNDVISVTVTGDQTNIKFIYNVICDKNKLANPVEWGKIIIVGISTIAIYLASKFQQAKVYNNRGYYVNYWAIGVFSVLQIISLFILMFGSTSFVTALCFWISVIIGMAGVMICCSEFFYCINIQFLRWRLCVYKGGYTFRLLDLLGFCIGCGTVCAWYFSGTNWIIGDTIYFCIYLATIKLVKFGSLKTALIAFIITMGLNIFLILLAQFVIGVYFNNGMLTLFNNPLFLEVPAITIYPNRKCSWLFLFSMALPGILLCYLERFDQSRSSKVYSLIFLLCYTLCSLAWILISIYMIFTLPYDIIIMPFAFLFIVLYANRRGQLSQLWYGNFYDEVHKHQIQHEADLKDKIEREQSPSQLTYKNSLFTGLKYENSSELTSREGTQLKQIYNPNLSKQVNEFK